jgi:hypothetical protein
MFGRHLGVVTFGSEEVPIEMWSENGSEAEVQNLDSHSMGNPHRLLR